MKPIVIEEDQKIPKFKFDEVNKFSPPLITLDKASVGYNDIEILKNINLQINPDDRIGLLGVNGEGKSTFSKLIAKKINLINGSIQIPQKLKIGYFAQHQLDELRPNETAFQHVYLKLPSEIPSKIRARLGSAGFNSDIMDLSVKRLSGGQKARLLLLLVVLEKPDLLILDEPTNHLDIESREALIMALNDYTGSLILVSHDAFLMERLVDRLLIVKDGNVSEFPGDIHEYRKLVLSNNNQKKSKQNNKLVNKSDNNFKTNLKLNDLEKKIKFSEKKIHNYEIIKAELEKEMTDQNFYQPENNKRMQEANIELKRISLLILESEKLWETLTNKIENKND